MDDLPCPHDRKKMHIAVHPSHRDAIDDVNLRKLDILQYM